MRKILISPGYGSGWTTCNRGSREFLTWLLEHKEIIEFLEADNEFTEHDCCGGEGYSHTHPILKKLEQDAKEKFGVDYVNLSGADQLQVEEVDGLVKIEEFDGYERIEAIAGTEWL